MLLAQSNGDGTATISLSIPEVAAEGSLAVLAGSDTTSGTLCSIVNLLLRYPQVYKNLREEIDKFYPYGENALDCRYHPQMHYLEAVM